MPIFSFPDNNLSKCQGILTKLGTCIDMKEVWFLIANEQILSMFGRVICLRNTIMAGYYSLTVFFILLNNIQNVHVQGQSIFSPSKSAFEKASG